MNVLLILAYLLGSFVEACSIMDVERRIRILGEYTFLGCRVYHQVSDCGVFSISNF